MHAVKLIIMGAGGRMGSTLANLALQDERLELAAVLEKKELLSKLNFEQVIKGTEPEDVFPQVPEGVVIDFTFPEVTMKTARVAARQDIPLVVGTTGFNADQMAELKDYAAKIPIFMAPNMSVGINVLLEFLPKLAKMLGEDFDLEISEIHHKHKKDAPSGTAVKLAQTLAQAKGLPEQESIRYCREGFIGAMNKEEIGVQTLRGGDVVGEHTVYFFGPGERIDVTHRAHSRETFAQGALRAAKWIKSKRPGGLYSMSDLFADLLR